MGCISFWRVVLEKTYFSYPYCRLLFHEHSAGRCPLFILFIFFNVKYHKVSLPFAHVATLFCRNIFPAQGVSFDSVRNPPRSSNASRFSHTHASWLDAEGGLGSEAATGAASHHKQIGNLVGHQGTIGNLIILALFQLFAEVQINSLGIISLCR